MAAGVTRSSTSSECPITRDKCNFKNKSINNIFMSYTQTLIPVDCITLVNEWIGMRVGIFQVEKNISLPSRGQKCLCDRYFQMKFASDRKKKKYIIRRINTRVQYNSKYQSSMQLAVGIYDLRFKIIIIYQSSNIQGKLLKLF